MAEGRILNFRLNKEYDAKIKSVLAKLGIDDQRYGADAIAVRIMMDYGCREVLNLSDEYISILKRNVLQGAKLPKKRKKKTPKQDSFEFENIKTNSEDFGK